MTFLVADSCQSRSGFVSGCGYSAFLFLVCGFGLPTIVNGQIYVTTTNTGAYKYNLDGTATNPLLIPGFVGQNLRGIAVIENSVLVTKENSNVVSKYTTTGLLINESFISGFRAPHGITVSGNDLYVGFRNSSATDGAIGKYDANTGAIKAAPFVSSLVRPEGMAVVGNDLFVVTDAFRATGAIAVYDATTGALKNGSLITGLDGPVGIAAYGGHLYVTNNGTGTAGAGIIREYDLDGSPVNSTLVSGLNFPTGIAAFAGKLYVVNNSNVSLPPFGTIGVYDAITGVTINAALISGIHQPYAIAVVPEPTSFPLAVFAIAIIILPFRSRRFICRKSTARALRGVTVAG